MAEQQIRIQVTADGAPAVAGLSQVDAALGKTSRQAGISAAQTAAAMRTLPAQFTDIATQLQGGSSPLTVLLQQGGQIKDSFGGVVPALRGVGAAIGPLLTNPVTLAAGAVLALGTAFEAGRRESVALANGLTLSGNAIGLTASQLNALAMSMDSLVGTRAGAAALLGTLVSEGGVAANMLQRVAVAATQLERAGGPAAAETAKAFAALGKEPLAAAVKLNESTNFLTASLYEQIRALEGQGRSTDAARLAQTAYADAIEQRTPKLEERLGSLERAWRAIKTGAAEAWDSMLNIGRQDTLGDKIAKAQAALEANARRTDRADSIGPNGRREGADAQRARLFAQLQALQQQQQFEEQAAQADLQRKKDTDKAIQTESAGHQTALGNLERAGLAQTLAVRQAGLDLATSLYANALEREQITTQEHAEAIRAIEVARVDAQLQNLERLRAIEAKRTTGSPDEQLAKQTALAGIEAQRLTLQGRRVALLAQEVKEAKSGEGYNLFASAATDPINTEEMKRRRDASIEYQKDLLQRTLALNNSLIKDDRLRGLAEIEAERQRIREKLDLQVLAEPARREAEDSLANYVLARNEQLNEQLKPQWQRMVEGWSDSTRVMREGWDSLMTTVLREGEDAFVQFVQTGKLQVKSLVNSMIEEFARAEFRKMVGGAAGGGGDLLSGIFSLASLAISGGQVSATSGMGMPNVGPQLPLNLPGRANGGAVLPGQAYQVNERGMPELLQVGGRAFLMMGSQAGAVSSPTGSGAAGAPVTVHQTINVAPGVDRSMVMAAMQQAKDAAVAAVADQVRRGNRAFGAA